MKYLLAFALSATSLSASATTIVCEGAGMTLSVSFSQDKSGTIKTDALFAQGGNIIQLNGKMEIDVLTLPKGEFLKDSEVRSFSGRYANAEVNIGFIQVVAVNDQGTQVASSVKLNNVFSVNSKAIGKCRVESL